MPLEDDPRWFEPDAEWKCAACEEVFKYGDYKKLPLDEEDEDSYVPVCPKCESEDIFPNDPEEWEREDEEWEEFRRNNPPGRSFF